MFELLKGKGFALTLDNGKRRVEVDFGPLSSSDNRTISKEAFNATSGKCANAEVRIYVDNRLHNRFEKMTPDELINLLAE